MLDSINPLKERMSSSPFIRNRRGFTLVELNTSITLIAILGISFMAIFSNFIVSTTRTNYSIEMTNQSQSLLRILVEELRYGAGVRQTNAIPDPNPDAPPSGWNTSNASFVIITVVPALNASNAYIIDDDTGQPYLNEYVYYKKGTLLYKRTLANPNAVDNKSTTSCSPTYQVAGCPTDRQLVDGLKTIIFNLYDQDNITPTTAPLARSIKIDLVLEKKTFGSSLTFDNSVRTTLRNKF